MIWGIIIQKSFIFQLKTTKKNMNNIFRKILLLCIVFYIIPCTAFTQSGWFALNTGSNRNFNSVFFADQNTGYISGDTLLKTTNGGLNWTFLNIQFPATVYFLNSQTGFIGVRTTNNIPNIAKTIDGGLNWSYTPTGTNTIRSFWFVNEMTGWAAGGIQFSGIIYKTTNGGTNWAISLSADGQMSVRFLDTNIGYSLGYYGSVRKSTNGGLNWSTMPNPPAGGNVWVCMSCTDISNIYLGSNTGGICKSTDGANTWNLQSSGTNLGIYSIFFVNTNTGYAVGGTLVVYNGAQVILKTTNGGTNWFTQQGVPPHGLLNVFFLNPATGWAVGDSGRVIKTTDGGGLVGVQPISNKLPGEFILHQNFPNPFNPSTSIRYDLSKGSLVKIIIIDVLGRVVKTLVNDQQKPGAYEVKFDGSEFASGIYYYEMESESFTQTRKMVLIK